MFKFKVANISVEYKTDLEASFVPLLSEYICDFPSADVSIDCRMTDKIHLPEHKITAQIKDSVIATAQNGNKIVYLKDKSGKIIKYTEFSPDFKYQKSEMVPFSEESGDYITDFQQEYLRSGALFNYYLISIGGTTLHGSAISYKGEGVIFSAPCGTGKSTHSSIWKRVFGADVENINDDKPIITFEDSIPKAWGAPWSGKDTVNNNISAPLRAIVFLERGKKNSISPLPTARAYAYLADQTFPPFYSPELGIKNMEVIERILKTVPIYSLKCNMEDEAAVLAKNTIFNGL